MNAANVLSMTKTNKPAKNRFYADCQTHHIITVDATQKRTDICSDFRALTNNSNGNIEKQAEQEMRTSFDETITKNPCASDILKT